MPNAATNTGTGAETPVQITHAFSLNQGHVAWAMLTGKKTIENRKFRMKPGWYGVSLSKVSHTGVAEDKQFRTQYRGDYPGFHSFYNQRGCLIGAVYVSHNLPHSACESDPFACPSYPIKNIITKCINLDVAIPCRGFVGMWPISEDSRDRFRQAIQEHLDAGKEVQLTGAEERFPPNPNWESSSKVSYEDVGVLPSKPKTKQVAKGKTKAPPPKPIVKTIAKSKPKPAFKSPSKPDSAPKKPLVASTSPSAGGAADIRQFFGGK